MKTTKDNNLKVNTLNHLNRKTMKTRTIIATIAVALIAGVSIFAACTKSDSFVISGSVENKYMPGKKVFITIFNNDGQETKDSTVIYSDGTFTFAGSVESPCVAFLSTEYEDEKPAARFHFFLENSNISIKLIEAKVYGLIQYFKPEITGSKSDATFRKDCGEIIKEHLGTEVWEEPAMRYLEKKSNTIYAPFIYYTVFFNKDDYKSYISQMKKFSGEAKNTYHYKLMKSKESMKKHIAIGAKIPDFTLPDTAGNEVNIFDFAKGKKYVLVSFWASWCGPCREEFKQLKELYAEYKDKGFDILAVSVDNNRAKWVKAIGDDALPWTNVSELDFSAKSVARSLFGISSVPYSFLIDGKGNIIQHGSNLDAVIKIYMAK